MLKQIVLMIIGFAIGRNIGIIFFNRLNRRYDK